MSYFQIGGLDSHTTNWFYFDVKKQSEAIFSALSAPGYGSDEKKKSVEMVLGILSSGASYLLITRAQMDIISRYTAQYPSRKPLCQASTYASLSPIYFRSPDELHTKLKTYVQKKAKAGKRPMQDTSQANKMFGSQQNLSRASFEHQRILWNAIQKPIDIERFALCELPIWIASTSLVALTLETWQYDPFEKRRKDPTVLNLELASIRCMAFENEDYAGQISHVLRVKIEEHSLMKNGNPKSTGSAETETVKKPELGRRLNDFFSSIDSKQALLLVYDAEQTISALEKLGINVSTYQKGIYALLYGDTRMGANNTSYSNDLRRADRYERHTYQRASQDTSATYTSWPDSRRRSRSPQRRSTYPQRPRSPPKPHLPPRREEDINDEEEEEADEETEAPPAKVFVIDVHALFLALSRLEPRGLKDLQDLAKRLGIFNESSDPCVGDGCRLLIEAWKCMASGNSIDEQHAERWSPRTHLSSSVTMKVESQPSQSEISRREQAGGNSEEEIDPNDVPGNHSAPQTTLTGTGRPQTSVYYDSDDSDY